MFRLYKQGQSSETSYYMYTSKLERYFANQLLTLTFIIFVKC